MSKKTKLKKQENSKEHHGKIPKRTCNKRIVEGRQDGGPVSRSKSQLTSSYT